MHEYNADQAKEVNEQMLKKSYSAPEVNKIGHIKELTLGTGSQFFDEGGIEPLF